jgi:DNA repair exonuclease SbcCD nuclease subunit
MDKVTCIAIGDPHFRVNNVYDEQMLISKVNKLVEQLQPTFVVILGDLLHTHERIHITPFKLATKFITSLARKVQVYVIIGNHDLSNCTQYLTDNHAFNAFKKLDNITICDQPIVRKINHLKFVFCPYVFPGRFEEALDTLQAKGKCWDNATCIFAHQEFYGCRFNPIQTSTDGDIWPDTYPMVVSGHIHNEQRLQENIYYTGSSMQHAFGESANKTIAYLSFRKDKPLIIKRIDLEMRKKKIVYLDIKDVDSYKAEADTYIKLVLKGNSTQFAVFRRGKKYKEFQKDGISISFSAKVENRVENTDINKDKRNVIDILHELIKDDDKYVHEAFIKSVKILNDNNEEQI